MKNIKISLVTLLSLSSIAMADVAEISDVEAKYSNKSQVVATKDLKQNINLGFSNTTGNTETLNVNGKYDASFITAGYNNQELKVSGDIGAFFTENNDIKSNEEFVANLGLEQFISNGWLMYTGLNWLRNPDFKNYDNKYALGVGVGKELFNDGKQTFSLKLGSAYNVEDYANNLDTEEFGSLNEYAEYKNQLNKVSKLYAKVGSMQNFDDMSNDYEVLGAIGVNFAVGENVSLSIEEEIAYDNLPSAGLDKTDTKSIVRVGYAF